MFSVLAVKTSTKECLVKMIQPLRGAVRLQLPPFLFKLQLVFSVTSLQTSDLQRLILFSAAGSVKVVTLKRRFQNALVVFALVKF